MGVHWPNSTKTRHSREAERSPAVWNPATASQRDEAIRLRHWRHQQTDFRPSFWLIEAFLTRRRCSPPPAPLRTRTSRPDSRFRARRCRRTGDDQRPDLSLSCTCAQICSARESVERLLRHRFSRPVHPWSWRSLRLVGISRRPSVTFLFPRRLRMTPLDSCRRVSPLSATDLRNP